MKRRIKNPPEPRPARRPRIRNVRPTTFLESLSRAFRLGVGSYEHARKLGKEPHVARGRATLAWSRRELKAAILGDRFPEFSDLEWFLKSAYDAGILAASRCERVRSLKGWSPVRESPEPKPAPPPRERGWKPPESGTPCGNCGGPLDDAGVCERCGTTHTIPDFREGDES